jgi:RNA polymerase sigma factor (sigma-70 family)
MARKQLGPVVHHIRKLAEPQAPADRSDGELLRRFAARREEAAFAALVRRHGALVLSVCRRVLRCEQDAEDAFQATFLVLARKAASVRREESLASWLYGVAHRTALKARADAAKRRAAGGEKTPRGQPEPPAEASLRELQRLLDEEVSRLPEKYRAPFVLCCLEGLSRAEAARQLGWNEGTLSGRLALARNQLRRRLTRRGVSLAAALCAVALSPAGSAALPAALAAATVRGVLGFTAGQAAGAGSVRALALAEGVLRTMSLTNLKIATALLLLALGVAATGVYALRAPAGEERPQTADPPGREGAEPRADRYGDALPPGAVARLGTVRFRSGGAPWIAFLPGDKALMTVGERTFSFWDVATGKETRFRADMGWGSAYALSPDGKVLAVAVRGDDSTIDLWEVAGGKRLRRLRGHQGGSIRAVAFAADGRTLVSGSEDKTVRVWDTATGQEVRRIEAGASVLAAAVAPDGKTLASAGWEVASTVRLHETATGKELRRFQVPMPVFEVVFAPDGKTLAALEPENGGSPESKVHLWDVATGQVRRLPPQTHRVWGAAFSPDGKTLATAHQETFHLWDLATGKALARFEGKSCYTIGLTFSGDGKTLATHGDNTIRLWDVATGKEVPCPGDGHRGPVEALAFLPDGKTLVTVGQDHGLRHWEAATGKEVRQFQGIVGTNGGRSFAAGGKVLSFRVGSEARACDPATGKELCRVTCPGTVYHTALTPDGKTLAVNAGGRDPRVRVVEAATGKERGALPPYEEYVAAIAFSPGGEVLAVGVEDHTVRLVDAATGDEIHKLQSSGTVTTLTFAPDGKTLAVIDKDSVRLWEVATGKERARLPGRESRGELAFSPDGTVLALGGEDGTVRLYRAATGKELGRLRGHRAWISCLAFSADGKTLASGSHDTTALVWDVSGLLGRKPEQPGELTARQREALWADLAGDDAARAYRAIHELAAAPGQAVPFLKARLRPAAGGEPKQIAALLADLDSDDFSVREKASAGLEELGEAAESALRQALEGSPSAEVRRRVEVLLRKLRKESPGPGRLRELRALEVLEQVGGPEARQVLAALARGAPEARLTRDAKAALDRRR